MVSRFVASGLSHLHSICQKLYRFTGKTWQVWRPWWPPAYLHWLQTPFSFHAVLAMSWACLGLSVAIPEGFSEYFFCIEWFSKNSFWEQWGNIKCLLSFLNGACLFLGKKHEWVEVKTTSFSFPSPLSQLLPCFTGVLKTPTICFIVSNIYKIYFLTLSFPLQ